MTNLFLNSEFFGFRIFRTINRTGDFTDVHLAKSARPVKGMDLLLCLEAILKENISRKLQFSL